MFDVTLSFDNGPEPEVTPAVLEILARAGTPSTFFVLGKKLADPERRKLAQRALAEGHWIGNHTYTHSVPFGINPDPGACEKEIASTQVLVGELAHPDRLFRPFGGGGNLNRQLLSSRAVDFLSGGGYSCVLWNAVPRDWEDVDGWVERALEQCAAQSWSLVVLHDLPTGAMRHLERFIERAREGGGRFRQDFPPQCVPIRRGRIVLPLEDYVAQDDPAGAPVN
jgi:peptidoglycan/xylan/chitin deacetylase (PgdA/CDA1 family)